MHRRKKTGYMISSVSETYQIHPQTLRLYERVGLLMPSRSDGNTRLYTDDDLERLETILNLTRDLGVNLAGVEVILNMREKMDKMRKELEELIRYVHEHVLTREASATVSTSALVRVGAAKVVRARNERQ
jgi:MerR family transcriptional regulator/heat shock protein HspR